LKEKFLKVPQSGTFKNFSGFYGSAKRCSKIFMKFHFIDIYA